MTDTLATLQCDTDRKQHAIAQDQNHRRCTRVAGVQGQIPRQQDQNRRREDDEITRRKHEVARRS